MQGNDFFSSNKTWTVTELNGVIKEILEGSFPQLKLEGEISNYRPNSSGHLYFNLKDKDNVISAVMFKFSASQIGFMPKDGMKVVVTGKISVYGPQGKYQIVISNMSVAGEGAILQMIEERKRRLQAEGLFDSSRKKTLPVFPKTIGVVTSFTGAAIRDILQIIKRRNKCIDVIILPSQVQGEGAAITIANQIKIANDFKLCDVLIVGRGGGSLEDLLPFSEEIVVRAIADSEIPVVSAVGHEIDWALSDYVADKRAPTPSAAAELCTPNLQDFLQEINYCKTEMINTMTQKIDLTKQMIKSFSPENFELYFRSIEQPLLMRFDNLKDALFDNINLRLSDTKKYIQNCITVLEASSPQTILNRGYSMVRVKNTNKIVTSSNDVSCGNEIEIFPAKGKIEATVTKI